MKEIFVFDVDGTLTPPRQKIVDEFARFFDQFATRNPVFLVSGSDLNKLKEQLPDDIFQYSEGIFTCSGAEFWSKGKLIYRRNHRFQSLLLEYLQRYVSHSPYRHKCGNHIEERPGMLNVSVVGRNAPVASRAAYHKWDNSHGERSDLVQCILRKFPNYEASASGEISVDIVPAGWNKSVALAEILKIHPNSAVTFFGDKMCEGGNDKPLADAISASPHHQAIPVKSFRDTWRYLCQLENTVAA